LYFVTRKLSVSLLRFRAPLHQNGAMNGGVRLVTAQVPAPLLIG
jgi:hypothetical protein